MNRERVVERLRAALPGLKARYPLHSLDLFGSVARGDESDSSDVDILLDIDSDVGLRIVDLSTELEQLVERPVDLATRRGINPRLLKRIESEIIHVE